MQRKPKQRAALIVVVIFVTYMTSLYYRPQREGKVIKSDLGASHENEKAYRYPDAADTGISDSTVFDFESRIGTDPDPEIVAWESIERIISSAIGGKDKRSNNVELLDAGCGMGRLMSKYCHHFSTCTCIDADPVRLKDAKALVGSLIPSKSAPGRSGNFRSSRSDDDNTTTTNYNTGGAFASAPATTTSTRAEFYLSSADTYKTDKRFDVILNSHVIQHVAESTALDIVTNLRKLLKPDGVLVIMTTHFPQTAYADVCLGYTHGNKEGCKKLQGFVSKEKFESIVEKNMPGVLPVHFWTAHALSQLATDAGCIGGGGGSPQYDGNRGKGERFTYTYFTAAAVKREPSLYEGSISAEEFLNNPISQGLVCRPQPTTLL